MIVINNDKLEKELMKKYKTALGRGYEGSFDNFLIGRLYYVVNADHLVDLTKIEQGLNKGTLRDLTSAYDKYLTPEKALTKVINNKDRYILKLIEKIKGNPLNKIKNLFNK